MPNLRLGGEGYFSDNKQVPYSVSVMSFSSKSMGSPSQGQVCGLCGNYDGNSKNDFTARSQETVADVLEFGNSWKVSSSCPNAQLITDPCASNRYRAAWSQKQCSIITSVTFQGCHQQVTMVTHMNTYINVYTHIHKHNHCNSHYLGNYIHVIVSLHLWH